MDLTRQVLSKFANQVYLNAITAFQNKDLDSFTRESQKFLQLITDLEELLSADDNFLLGTWLESAKKLALNPKERRQVRDYICIFIWENNFLEQIIHVHMRTYFFFQS